MTEYCRHKISIVAIDKKGNVVCTLCELPRKPQSERVKGISRALKKMAQEEEK